MFVEEKVVEQGEGITGQGGGVRWQEKRKHPTEKTPFYIDGITMNFDTTEDNLWK